MFELSVCVGSSCHLKGSYDIVKQFKKYVNDYNLENDIIIKGAFCLGHCTEAVSVKFNNTIYSVNKENAKNFFEKIVIKNINNERIENEDSRF